MVHTKYCFIRCCYNNSLTSNKFFVTVPRRLDIRTKWYHAVNMRDEEPTKTSSLYCCEDHFDLENDVENWIYYKMMGRKIILKKGVVPHIFPLKKDESISQFTEEDKELKRQILEDFQNSKVEYEHLVPKQERFSYSSNYSVETSVVDLAKNVLVNVKENNNIKSQFLVNSILENEWQNTSLNEPEPPSSEEERIIPARINIQIDPDLPELIWCKDRQDLREKHQPLLLRRKNKIKKIPEVVWINPPLVEISNEDELETRVENAGTIEIEQQLEDSELVQIKTDTEFVEIKQEEIKTENITLDDSTANYVYFTTHDDILLQTATNPTMYIPQQLPNSVQSFLNVDSYSKDVTMLDNDSQNQVTNIPIKEESVDETEDFEFVNVNTKTENGFFFEDPLKISGKNIFVAKQTEESILS